MRDSSQSVICVAGMHRSGTSMIARLLNLCGMDLGQESDMMPAGPANPEGYWEHIWFNYYNNELLDFFRSAWDHVPVLPANWVDTPGIAWVRREAEGTIARFQSPVWGWKDPRNSITLRFWKQLLPGMKTVVCLRSPLDVANSLNKRGSSSLLFGLLLWWQYNSILLMETREDERVVTHFDAYFRSGHAELDRLVKSLGIATTDAAIEEACKSSKDSLRHSVTSIKDLERVTPWPDLVRTYCKLLDESGEGCRELMGAEWDKVEELAARWTTDSCCLPMVTSGHELQQRVAELTSELEARIQAMNQQAQRSREQIADLHREIELLRAMVAQISGQRDGFAAARDAAAAARDAAAAERDAAAAQRDYVAAENQAIRSSKTWKIMTQLGSVAVKTGLVKPAG